jgi:glycyl-tRNA synthetase beta chain
MTESERVTDFLFEIGTEDLPARFLGEAVRQFGENTRKILSENRIRFSSLKTFGTPRRIAVLVEGVSPVQDDITKEVLGPSVGIAFDSEGKPTKAAHGFARANGVKVEGLVIRKKGKGEHIAAVIDEKGSPSSQILPGMMNQIVHSIYLPKAMRWGTTSLRFVRPIRWFLSILGNETVRFEMEGIESGNLLHGHRFLSPSPQPLNAPSDYEKVLQEKYVLADFSSRRAAILEKMNQILAPFRERAIHDEDLLETVTNLVEYPVPVMASFPERYLELPKELLITVMKGHQKYFAVESETGKITHRFIVVSNTSQENADVVKTGAEKVIRARFEDARFYFEEDRKRRLSERVEDLKKVTFHEGLGSVYDKTKRLEELSLFISSRLRPALQEDSVRAALLSKTDLITGVVREFPELQGIMGRYYASHDGEKPEVARALEEQYLPAHSGGKVPESDQGAILSLSDKADTVAAFFSIGAIPTGSEDPFALRRQALGIVAILREKDYPLTLRGLFEKALENFSAIMKSGTEEKMRRFLEARLEAVFSDLGYTPEFIQSILGLSFDTGLNALTLRMEAVKHVREKSEFADFLTAVKRVSNIIPKAAVRDIDITLLRETAEKQLKEQVDKVGAELDVLLPSGRYDEALVILSSLTGPVNQFFESVLVMEKEEDIRHNRLALLSDVWSTVSRFADFSKYPA